MSSKVEEWMGELYKLATVVLSKPQAAYTAFVHGAKTKWNYVKVCRTIPNCSHLL